MYKSHVDVKSIKDLTRDQWQIILKHSIGQEAKLQDGKDAISLEVFKGTNDFYNSELVKGKITYNLETEEGNHSKELNVVIKNPVKTTLHKLMSQLVRPFMFEGFFYVHAAQAFPEINDLLPKCYHCHSHYSEELFDGVQVQNKRCYFCWCFCRKPEVGILIMEDLTKCGYKMTDKTKIMDVESIKFVFRELAKFHGIWFQFLREDQSKRRNFPFTKEDLKKSAFNKDLTRLLKFVGGMYKDTMTAIEVLMKNRGEDQELIDRVNKYKKEKMMQNMFKIAQEMKDGTGSSLITITHGDFWSNNVMFKYKDEEGGSVVNKVKFLDFQMAGIGYPYTDLMYFIYINTDYEFRKKNLDNVLLAYFEVLKTYFGDYKMTFQEFCKEYEYYLDFSLIGIGVSTNVLSPYPMEMKGIRMFQKIREKIFSEIAGEEKEDEHPMILEIRRRLLDFVHELADRKIL